MTTVAVTGATGIFGLSLCEVLDRDPAVDRVVGVARRPFDPAAHGLAKMVFRRGDVLDPAALDEAFAGADVVCHLAFTVLERGAVPDRVRRINVDGSANVFDAAARTGARRIVYASSIAAYGAHPDNPVPIHEDWPTRGNDAFYYSQHKAEVERLLDAFEAAKPDVEVVRIRPCVVVGPHSIDLFRGPLPTPLVGLALSPFVPWTLPDPGMASMQFVHEDDVAEVFRLGIVADGARGAYNLAGDGTLTPGELARALGAVRVPVPGGLARRAVDVAHRVGLSPAGASWLDVARYPITVDTTRARTELGWVPRYDSRGALADMLERFRAASPLARLR
jgi:nucleoside-diphosphate-sugar epimerase